MHRPYSDAEMTYIRTQYPTIGATWCGRNLKRPTEVIRRMAKKMGLKGPAVRYKPDSTRNVDPRHFRQIELPEVAYFLGYFWADGHIHSYHGNGNIVYHRVAIEVQKEDGEHLKRIAETFGRWAVVERRRKRYGVDMKPVLGLVINNEPVYTFLKEHGYDDKSTESPHLILTKIPAHLHAAFWLGVFDGDGSIVIDIQKGRKTCRGTVQFSGTYEQDWSALIEMWARIGIYPHPRKSVSKRGHKSSTVTVQNRIGVNAFYEYIKPFDRLGLPRKQTRFRDFTTKYLKTLDAATLESHSMSGHDEGRYS